MKVLRWLAVFIFTGVLCGCEEIGIVEKSKLDDAMSEIAQLKSELEQSNSIIASLKHDNEGLKNRLNIAEKERDEYWGILKVVCHKSERIEKIINNEDHVSFWDLEQAVTDLRESLGYKQVYYNYSSQPFQSQQTTVTKQPFYLFK